MIQVQIELSVKNGDVSDMHQVISILERDDATNAERAWAEKIQQAIGETTVKAMTNAGMTVKTTRLDAPKRKKE